LWPPIVVPDAPALAGPAPPDDPAPSPDPEAPFRSLDPLDVPLPLNPGPRGTSCLSSCSGSWWVTFPSSTWRLRPFLGALRSPRVRGRCPGHLQVARVLADVLCPAFRADVDRVIRRLGAPALTLLGDMADQAVQAGGLASFGLPSFGGAPGAQCCPLPSQRVPVWVGRVRRNAGLWPDPNARSCPALGRGGSGPFTAPSGGFGCSVRLALCRVCEVAPSFVSSWRAFSSISLCKNMNE
jgi:hypothetical protein